MPVYSVDTEEYAEELLVLTCQTDVSGQFIAHELADEQTLGNLAAFSDRLAERDEWLQERKRARAQEK